MDRRNFLSSASGFLTLAMQHNATKLFAATHNETAAKRCLVLWMEGGPSQLETFDPKPGTDTGGPTESISTSVAGMKLAANLPHLAKQADKLAILRNVGSEEGEHFRATYYLHTGYRQVPGFPRPAIGSVVSHSHPEVAIPKNVTLGGQGFGPAYLGLKHAPFSIEEPAAALEQLNRLGRRRRRLDLIRSLNTQFDATHPQASNRRRSAMMNQLHSLMGTPFVQALNVEKEPASSRERYGDGRFAENCLIARRLLESGVRFVEVRHSGWDTHNDNFGATRRLCEEIDRPYATLLADLESSGLLDETLVIWMGEFGRTPIINGNKGRDHFPDVTPIVLSGAGLTGGQVVGATNATGTKIDGKPHSIADLFATIFSRLGIDLEAEFTTEFGSPTTLTDDGTPIAKLA